MSIRFALPSELRGAVDQAAADWTANNKVARFWQKDPSLWTSDGEEKWLGWIDIVERQQKDLATYAALGAEVETADFQTILLLGMGGSSLCPEVLALTFGQQPELSRAAHRRFHRSGAGMDRPQRGQSGRYAGRRGQQIRLHARAEYPQAVFLQ